MFDRISMAFPEFCELDLLYLGQGCMKSWYVYMIRCRDDTLYTGATTDVDRRFAEHQQAGPKAAWYLKGRGPLQLIFTVPAGDHKTALKLERRIKGLPKARKEAFIQHSDNFNLEDILNEWK